MIKKIAHLADIHIRKSPTRHEEYYEVFDNTFKQLKKDKPDRIVIVGDLVHDYLDLQGEQLVLASYFLNGLAEIAPVRITRGNHDIRKKSLKRTDSIEAVVKAINNPEIVYYNETNFFEDDNITWAVWKHGDKNNSPWTKRKKHVRDENQTYIDLFHDPINGSRSATGYEFKKKSYNSINNFKGDYSFLGDIHLKQYFRDGKIAYPSSLIAQDFSEGDDKFHGYLLWNVSTDKVKEVEIPNQYSFKTIRVNTFTDFDDLDIDIDNPTKFMKIRIVWNVLPAVRNKENERKLMDYVKNKFNPVLISTKNEFIEEDVIDEVEELTIDDIQNQEVQHEIFVDYLTKIGVQEDVIEKVVELDDEISSMVEPEEFTNILWSIVRFKGTNFMSYEEIEVDWRDDDGLYQISGLNTAGKTTIMKLITYILYNNTLETETKKKFGDVRYVNNVLDVNFCEGELVLDVNGQYFGVKRTTTIEYKKTGEVKGSPTTLSYYLLESPDDELSEENSIEVLNEEDRIKTNKEIEKAIGSYDNFMRIVMTTSDTLNRVLSNDKAEFVDSLLYDSGLDIFDLKLEAFKEYKKNVMSLPRVSCNVEKSEKDIEETKGMIEEYIAEKFNLETVVLNQKLDAIKTGEDYIETLNKKLYKIDEDLYNLNIDDIHYNIGLEEDKKKLLRESHERIKNSISELKDSYDKERLDELINKKDSYKQLEYDLKLRIKSFEREIVDEEHKISNIRGTIVQSKNEGGRIKNEIAELKKSKICPTCGQEVDAEHQKHITEKIKEKEKAMFEIADLINEANNKIPQHEDKIAQLKEEIKKTDEAIEKGGVEMDGVLTEIGVLTNDKNDFEKREKLVLEEQTFPVKIENVDLSIKNLNQKIDLYNQNLSQIEKNKKINQGIDKAKMRLSALRNEEIDVRNQINQLVTKIDSNKNFIEEIKTNIEKFVEQENHDYVMKTYQKCVHRDGIPTQLLKSYAIPKINDALSNILHNVDFDVWLDEELKLQLVYSDRPNAVIDAIGGSGKERTFASVGLKFALNQINTKSKPTILLLDEIMGKLSEDSVEEFVLILQTIVNTMKKVLIVEHNHNIDYDYLIEVTKDSRGVSTINIS